MMMNKTTTALAAVLIALAGCKGGGGGGSEPAKPNRAPAAKAGPDRSEAISPEGNALDGASSSDPDGDRLTYSWTVAATPEGRTAAIADAGSATATLTADGPGAFEVSLTVTDPSGAASTDRAVITLTNAAPTIRMEAMPERTAVGKEVRFDASGSADPDGHALTYAWSFDERPADSLMPDGYDGAAPIMRFDLEGDYVLRLTVSDGYASASQALEPITVLPFDVVPIGAFADAEFDWQAGRLVTVDGDVLRSVTLDGESRTVALPLTAAAVSVAPDGRRAAVAHDGWVSHVDLDEATRLATHSVPADLGDVVLDGNGIAFGFPATDQWVEIHRVDMGSGVATTGEGWGIRDGTVARLHPSGTKMYGADNGLSPSDLERYDITEDTVTVAYDSPYHGDYPFCGDLWFGPRAETILSRCGVVVRATDTRATDMTYVMQLPAEGGVTHAAASAHDDAWYVVGGGGQASVSVFDAATGRAREPIAMPTVEADGVRRWLPLRVFADPGSSALAVLAVDDGVSPPVHAMLTRGGVADTGGGNLAPEAKVARYATVRAGASVRLDASASADPEGAALSYAWTLASTPSGSVAVPAGTDGPMLDFAPDVAGSYEFELRVSDGERQSALARATVNAFAPGTDLVHRLTGTVGDVEASGALGALVYLDDDALRIMDLTTFSERTVALDRTGYTLGVSPDGLRAAVSHEGQVSLVDLETARVVDGQDYGADWGDVVLDDQYRAHLVPWRDQWSEFYTIDFAANTATSAYGPRAGTQLRMHPDEPWVYGADRGLSPSDFEKWDVSGPTPQGLGDSPYHGDYAISGNLWIAEDGDRLLTAGGNAFRVSADPATDMRYAGALAGDARAAWADHSEEAGEWAVIERSGYGEPGAAQVSFFGAEYLSATRRRDVASVPSAGGDRTAVAEKVFFAEDGRSLAVVLRADGLADAYAVQVMGR